MISLVVSKQTKGFCGPFAVKAILDYYGVKKTIEEIAELIHATHDYGCDPKDIVEGIKKIGFKAFYKKNSSIEEVKKYVDAGVPVIVEWFSPEDNGHYTPVVGFEDDEILLADSLLGDIRRLNIKQFMFRWFELDKYPPEKAENFSLREIIIIYPKDCKLPSK
ncbi:MAG: C39 family peptidase [Candidatus Woesebacteria bacterium]|nr:C39 family peptidase [Candidatus Woesebacteria bacterium]